LAQQRVQVVKQLVQVVQLSVALWELVEHLYLVLQKLQELLACCF
jgi:hypothetical protein